MKLKKFEKFVMEAVKGFTSYDFVVLWLSFLLCALFKDLSFDYAYSATSAIFIMIGTWYFCTFLCMIVLAILKKKRSKKLNIEKIIDEESKKGE